MKFVQNMKNTGATWDVTPYNSFFIFFLIVAFKEQQGRISKLIHGQRQTQNILPRQQNTKAKGNCSFPFPHYINPHQDNETE